MRVVPPAKSKTSRKKTGKKSRILISKNGRGRAKMGVGGAWSWWAEMCKWYADVSHKEKSGQQQTNKQS